jgi:protein TonB
MPTPQTPPGASQAAPAPPPLPRGSPDFLLGQTKTRDTYFNRLARHISQFRLYPASSRSRNEQGRVVMRVTVARDGHLLDVKVEKSSGYPTIDAAEIETIRKASPFPPLPPDIPGERVVFILPITYELR